MWWIAWEANSHRAKRRKLLASVAVDRREEIANLIMVNRCEAIHARVVLDWTCGQATEGQWGMPGHTEAMKGAVSCDKPRGGAHTR
jgi:hypothetical protein